MRGPQHGQTACSGRSPSPRTPPRLMGLQVIDRRVEREAKVRTQRQLAQTPGKHVVAIIRLPQVSGWRAREAVCLSGSGGWSPREHLAGYEHRRPIRAHDLRATFIPLALARGMSEQWVMDRTGHATSAMLPSCRRDGRRSEADDAGAAAPGDPGSPPS